MIGNSALAREFWEHGRSQACPIYDMHGHMGTYGSIYFPRAYTADMVRTMDECGVRMLVFSHHMALFSPDLAQPMPHSAFSADRSSPVADVQAIAKAQRHKFQSGLLAWYRGAAEDAGLQQMHAVLVELQQAGLFEIAGYEGEELSAIVGSFCPNILFPYAREGVAAMIQKGGFPEFVLQPINFDALYMQSKQQQAEKAAAGEAH